MIDKEFNETKTKIEKILTEIAIHKDTRQKLVKEVGGLELIKHTRAMEIEENFLYSKKVSADLVYLLSAGDVKQLIIIQGTSFKDNTAKEYIIRYYIIITSMIYSLLTVGSINFIIRKRKYFKEWLAKQNIS